MITDNCQTYVRDFFDFLMEDGEPDAVNKLPRKQSPLSSEMEKEEVEASPHPPHPSHPHLLATSSASRKVSRVCQSRMISVSFGVHLATIWRHFNITRWPWGRPHELSVLVFEIYVSILFYYSKFEFQTALGKVSRKNSCSFGFCPIYLDPPSLSPIWTTCTTFFNAKNIDLSDIRIDSLFKILLK